MRLYQDRVLATSVSTGTGNFALDTAVTGFAAPSDVTVGDTFEYVIYAVDGSGVPSGAWETGIGTFTDAGATFSRAVEHSSNGDALVDFAAGTKYVGMTVGASTIDALVSTPYTLIAELTAPTGGSFDFPGLDFSDYDEIEVELQDIQFSVAGRPGIQFYLAGSLTTTEVYFSTDSRASSGSAESNAAAATSGATFLDETSNNWWTVPTTTDTGANYTGRLRILNPNSANHRSFIYDGNGSRGNSGASLWTRGGGTIRSASALTGVNIVSTSGTISAGVVRIWGVKRAAVS